MEKVFVLEKYPVWTTEIFSQKSMEEIIESFKKEIESDQIANFIGVFDHYTHTKNINGEIDAEIKDAKIILFCFGKQIKNPLILAARPRNLAITKYKDRFVISFLEAPQEAANLKIKGWIEKIFLDN